MSTETVSDLAERWLAQAYELVERGWCRGAAALDDAGEPVEPENPLARRWSATGALVRAWRTAGVEDEALALGALGRANLALAAAVGAVPAAWNDASWRTKGQVLDALLTAVSLVQDTAEIAACRAAIRAETRKAARPAPGALEQVA